MKSLLAVVSVPLFAAVLHAQNPRGTLRGTVQDATGARVASAKVVLQSRGTSTQRETSSEDRGEFRLDDLLPILAHDSHYGFSPGALAVGGGGLAHQL